MRIGLIMIGVTALSACSTPLKKANEMLEAGNFVEASQMYENLVKKEPDNVEAVLGLKKSREKLLDKILIDERKARLSGNEFMALDFLLSCQKKQGEWQMPPSVLAGTTQEEELDGGLKFLTKIVDERLTANQPLGAEISLVKYDPLYSQKAQASGQAKWQALREKTRVKGRSWCVSEVKSAGLQTLWESQVYHTEFLERACRYFGEEPFSKISGQRKKRIEWSVTAVHLNKPAAGLPPDITFTLEEEINQGIRVTGWYESLTTRVLKIDSAGTYRPSHQTEPVRLTHAYEEEVPYTEYEDKKEKKLVNGQWVEHVERVPVTKKRREMKTLMFDGKKHSQTLTLAIQLDALLGDAQDLTVGASHSSDLHEEGVEHSQNIPALGLTPKRAELRAPSNWLKEQLQVEAKKFVGQLHQKWIDQMCASAAGVAAEATAQSTATLSVTLNEQMLRCLRDDRAVESKAVLQWGTKEWGVDPNDVLRLIGWWPT